MKSLKHLFILWMITIYTLSAFGEWDICVTDIESGQQFVEKTVSIKTGHHVKDCTEQSFHQCKDFCLCVNKFSSAVTVRKLSFAPVLNILLNLIEIFKTVKPLQYNQHYQFTSAIKHLQSVILIL